MARECTACRPCAVFRAIHRSTPPEERYRDEAGLLARGSSRRFGSSRREWAPVTQDEPPLAAYSCGGSAGFRLLAGATGFPS